MMSSLPRVVFAPGFSVGLLVAVAAGIALGTASGLTPGVHANTFALLLAAGAPSVPGPPALVGAAMLAAAVVHTFLDVVPALALGVPDPAMAATALPGHRLVIEGRGREALRLSALGSVAAAVFALVLATPVSAVMLVVYPVVAANLPVFLAGVVAFLVVTEPTKRAALGGTACFIASAVLGLLTLDATPSAPLPTGDVLAPLFAGLFGAPVLLDAANGDGVPPQDDADLSLSPRTLALCAVAGTIAGALVGYLPGVSSAVAAVVALLAVPGNAGAREYIVASSGANTATAIFALFALASTGEARTGVLVALSRANVPLDLPVLLGAVVLAAFAGVVLVTVVGDPYLRVVGGADYRRVSAAVLCVLVVFAFLFAGAFGVGVFAAATVIGLLPVRVRTRRVHLMGVLLGPLMLG